MARASWSQSKPSARERGASTWSTATRSVEDTGGRVRRNSLAAPAVASTMRERADDTSASRAVLSGMYAPPLPSTTQAAKFCTAGQGVRVKMLAMPKVRKSRSTYQRAALRTWSAPVGPHIIGSRAKKRPSSFSPVSSVTKKATFWAPRRKLRRASGSPAARRSIARVVTTPAATGSSSWPSRG